MSPSDAAPLPVKDDARIGMLLNRTGLLDEFLRRTRDRHEAMVAHLEALSLQKDRVLFDGEWVEEPEADRRYRALRARQWLQMAELVVLMLVILASGGICLGLLLLLYL